MIRFLLPLLAVTFLLTSCKSTEKLLVKKDGEWLATTLLYQHYENGSLVGEDSYSNHLVFVFEKEGGGVVKSDQLVHGLSWSVDDKDNRILICEEDQDCVWYEILQSEKEVQTWFGTLSYPNGRTDITMRMVRL
jgi:hypothetical protein